MEILLELIDLRPRTVLCDGWVSVFAAAVCSKLVSAQRLDHRFARRSQSTIAAALGFIEFSAANDCYNWKHSYAIIGRCRCRPPHRPRLPPRPSLPRWVIYE